MSSDPSKDKPRLTEQEKKNNHIASEQKRRQAIREGFDRLASLVPGMDGQGRSESLVLNAAIEYLKEQLVEHRQLLADAKARGINVSDIEIPDLEPPAENGLNGNGNGNVSASGLS
jgi:hypothetical protein